MKIMKLFLAVLACCLLLLQCSKPGEECEVWQVRDYCQKKTQRVSCDESGTIYQRNVCGNDLTLARSGKMKVRMEDADIKLLTEFIKKVQ